MPHASIFDRAESHIHTHASGEHLDDHRRLAKSELTTVGGVRSNSLHDGGTSISGDDFVAALDERLGIPSVYGA